MSYVYVQNIYQKKFIAIENFRQNIDSKGEPLGPQAYFFISFDRSLINSSSFVLYVFTIYLPEKKLLPSKNIDKKSILQVSHEARGPIFGCRSIELDYLNNFCSIYL